LKNKKFLPWGGTAGRATRRSEKGRFKQNKMIEKRKYNLCFVKNKV
jgi:hypothetical protein